MSSKIRKSLNYSKIIENANEYNINEEAYHSYIKKHITEDFKEKTEENLMKIYANGEELLDYYYIQEIKKENMNKELINEITYILGNVTYHLNNKLYNELKNITQKTLEELKNDKATTGKIKKEFLELKEEAENIKKEQKALVTTIIVILITISIIPTALAGMERIDSNYIIPFVASVIFFGMIMMTFIYTLFTEKIKEGIKMFMVTFFMLVVIIWLFSINMDYSDDRKKKENDLVPYYIIEANNI